MNFLAHLWLADRTGTSPAGAILGDWVRGRVPPKYPEELRVGIALHRRVDTLTDAHPVIAIARSRFPAGPRRYAGIVLDLITDHLLARRWSEFSTEPLEIFTHRGARDVEDHSRWFADAGGFAPSAAEFERLLLSYASADGIDHAIRRTSRRLRKPEGLLAAAQDWQPHAAALDAKLADLLNDVSAAANLFTAELRAAATQHN